MTRVFNGERTFLSPVLRPVEAVLYTVGGVDERREQHWLTYTVAMLLFNAGGLPAAVCADAPAGRAAAQSGRSSRRWRPTSPSTRPSASSPTPTGRTTAARRTMSYLTQMLGLTVQNFVSAATGIVLAVALIRGFARASANTIGNFWVDVTRCTLYVLLPVCVIYGLFLVWQGIPQTLGAYVDATTLEGGKQTIAHRPGRLADRHQDARHQRRRLLQRQRRASLREPHGAVELRADDLDLRHRRGADQRVRPHGRRRAPGLGHPRRDGRAVHRRRRRHLLGRGARQRRLHRHGPDRRQHGGQGGPLRHRRVRPVRRHHHGRLVRRRQRHARQLHAARRHDPAHQHAARRDHRRRRRRRPLRHAALRHHRHLRRRPDGRAHAGVRRQEDRGARRSRWPCSPS